MTRDEIVAYAKQLDIELCDYQLDYLDGSLKNLNRCKTPVGRRLFVDSIRALNHILNQGCWVDDDDS